MQVRGCDQIPANRVPAPCSYEPSQCFDQDSPTARDDPGPAEQVLDELNDALWLIGQICMTQRFAVEVSQTQIGSEISGLEFLPEGLGSRQGRHHAQIDRHWKARLSRDEADLPRHCLRRLLPRVEEISVGDA